MPRKKKPKGEKFVVYAFKMPPQMLRGLRDVQKVTHVVVAEQIRLGVSMWLESQAKTLRRAKRT